MNVILLAHTPEPARVVATAAKLCYSSSDIGEISEKMSDEEVSDFIKKLSSLGHESPFEHASFTFGIEGVSRSLSHQLVRHRIASYSQKSQRYVREGDFEYIIPSKIQANSTARSLFIEHMVETQKRYDYTVLLLMVDILYEEYIDEFHRALRRNEEFFHLDDGSFDNVSKGIYSDLSNPFSLDYMDTNVYEVLFSAVKPSVRNEIEKRAIEEARAYLPNATETKIVVTMNARALRNFITLRTCMRAQDEIRNLALRMLTEAKHVAPELFEKAGPGCVRGKCPEGPMSCGMQAAMREFF